MEAEPSAETESEPGSLCSTPKVEVSLSDYESALDHKRWKVHGEDYEQVEERLQSVCTQVQESLAQLIGAMRDLEVWQATAAKTCELPTNSLAKITVITSQMVRSRSTLSGQLGTLQHVCRCFFPSTMLLEITGQRELQARAEVEIEKWAQLAFTGQQTAKKEFRTLRAALHWYRLSKQLTDGLMQQFHQARIRKLRARIGELERRNRGLRGQLAWEKKRADRAFGALHINRKLARSLAPGDWDSIRQQPMNSVNGDKGWASARGVDTRTPRQKGELSSRSLRPSTRGGAGQNGKELKTIERRMRDSLGDALANGDGEEELFPFESRPSEIDPRRKGVTNADFAAAVASLAAKIREATNMRIESLDLSPQMVGNAANSDKSGLLSASAPLPDVDWAAAFGSVSNSGAMAGAEAVDTNLDSNHPVANGPERSSSPVLNARKSGKFIPSLNMWKRGVSGALQESRKGGEGSPSSSESTPKSDPRKSGASWRDSHLQRIGSKAANPDAQPGVTGSAGAATSASLPKLTSPIVSSAQLNGIASLRNGLTEQPPASKLPSLTQAQNPQTQTPQTQNPQTQSGSLDGPIVPRLPLGTRSARRYETDSGTAGTERLAKALGIAFAPEMAGDSSGHSSQSATNKAGTRARNRNEEESETSSGQQDNRAGEKGPENESIKPTFRTTVTTGDQMGSEFRPGFVIDSALSSKPTVLEPSGSVTERGTASTLAAANGDENREFFSKRDFLAVRLEQSRQLQHLQALYEERIQSLHDFYEKLLHAQLPAVLSQLTTTISASHSLGQVPRFSDLLSKTPETSTGAKDTDPKNIAASVDTSRKGFKKVVKAVHVTRSLREPLTQRSLGSRS